MKDKKTIFEPGGDPDALDLFDSFSETKEGEDPIDPIGLIDVPGEDTRNGILSESESKAITGVSPEQLKAVLERVVDRIFTQRIEAILREVIEKSVSEEIGKWRGALLDNIAVDDDL